MIAINKLSSKLKNWSVEMPNAPYLNRCVQLGESFQINRFGESELNKMN